VKKLFLIAVSLFLLGGKLISQNQKIDLYLIPGMGTDHRIYKDLDFGLEVNKKLIYWPENATELKGLKELALAVSTQIDTTRKFVILGNSMGGMISMELSKLVSPEAIILVSSINSSSELPTRYKLGRMIPLHKLLTEKRLVRKANNPRTFRKVNDPELRNLYPLMLKTCGSEFLKWQMNSIVHWKFKQELINCEVYHIHGKKDRVLPLRKTTANQVLESGTHKLVANFRTEIVNSTLDFLKTKKLIN